jgi:hypothetical protein
MARWLPNGSNAVSTARVTPVVGCAAGRVFSSVSGEVVSVAFVAATIESSPNPKSASRLDEAVRSWTALQPS